MSFESPHSPNRGSSSSLYQAYANFLPDKGSGSQRSAPPPQHTMASSGVRLPSTSPRTVNNTAPQYMARQLRHTRMNMGSDTKTQEVPSKVGSKCPHVPNTQLLQEPAIHPLLFKEPRSNRTPDFPGLLKLVHPCQLLVTWSRNQKWEGVTESLNTSS